MLKNFGFHSEQIVKYFEWRDKPFGLNFKRFTLAANGEKRGEVKVTDRRVRKPL